MKIELCLLMNTPISNRNLGFDKAGRRPLSSLFLSSVIMMKIGALFVLLALPVAAMAQGPAATEAPSGVPNAEDRIKSLEDRIEKLESAPAKASISSFNPAMGMALDTVFRNTSDKATFDFRAAELNLEAAADPFVKVFAIITGSPGGVEVEEAAAQTTALPYNLTARAGRVFAPFGRFSAWHDHELPMVYRPNSLATYVGNESHADGLDVNYLFPTPFYLEGYVGAYNKLGANNNRADFGVGRPLDQFTYLGRLHGYTDLGNSWGADLGTSLAWTPKRQVVSTVDGSGLPLNRSFRTLAGVDLTLRYQPSVGGLYHGIMWTTEVLQNNEQAYASDLSAPVGRAHSYAGYSNIETKLGRVTRVGGFVDLTELPGDRAKVSKTFAGYLTFEITEFNRLRLEYSRTVNNFRDAVTGIAGTDFGSGDLYALRAGHMIALQWSCVIGYHVHGFRGRWGT